jgi:predicted dehydrogenase
MSKLKLIQCGVGGFGKGWIENYSTQSADFDLVAIVDFNAESLAAARTVANLPEENCFASLEAALQSVEADAVLSVTPPAVHVQHARLAFAKGLHFMCEKPLADTIEHAREMISLAGVSGKQLAVSQNYRFRPFIQKLKSLLQEEAVGEFGHGHMDFYIPADFTGSFREDMEYPLLLDMAIHHFDLIRCVTGRDITRVLAWSFRPSWSWYAHEPGLKMLLELEGGLPFSYSGDWSARGRSTSWNGDWRLQCSEGALLFENDEIFVARSERWSREQTIEPIAAPGMELENQAATLHLFAEAIRSGKSNEISGANNFASFAAVQAGIESAQQGKAVEVARTEK